MSTRYAYLDMKNLPPGTLIRAGTTIRDSRVVTNFEEVLQTLIKISSGMTTKELANSHFFERSQAADDQLH